jgi:DNA-binding response OmpR family regulator
VQRSSEQEPTHLDVGQIALDREAHVVRVSEREVSLTPTEFRLLECLMSSPGRTFTRQQLLDRVAGPDFAGFDRNVDVHVANLRRKLGIAPSPIRTVYGVGYRLQPERQ